MKKYIVTLLIVLLASETIYAQLLGSLEIDPLKISVSATPDSLIIKALKGSPVIIKQSYQVKNKKTGKIYGRSGRKDFGHNYTIGVKTEYGLVLTNDALKPWQFDDAYKKVEQEYEPAISLTEIRNVDSDNRTKFTQTPLKISRQQIENVWFANEEDIQPNSMEIDLESGQKNGCLIWFIAKRGTEINDTTPIVIQSVSKTIEVIEGSDIEIDSPSNIDHVIGGFYVCPVYLGGGHVTYKLVGIAVKDGDNKWKLLTPFVGFSYNKPSVSEVEQPKEDANSEKTSEEAVQEDQQDIELTPIDEGKKKKGKKSKK